MVVYAQFGFPFHHAPLYPRRLNQHQYTIAENPSSISVHGCWITIHCKNPPRAGRRSVSGEWRALGSLIGAHRCTSGMADYVAHDYLAEITLHFSPENQLRGPELLRPLNVFTHLSRLSVTSYNSSIAISCDGLQTLMLNWPCLEAIQIISLRPFLTLPQLFSILKTCPWLQICGLGTIVNPHDVDSLLDNEDEFRVYGPHRNVELLILSHATEETQHVWPTVQALSRTVPRLKSVGSEMDYNVFDLNRTARSKFWVDVLDGVQEFNEP